MISKQIDIIINNHLELHKGVEDKEPADPDIIMEMGKLELCEEILEEVAQLRKRSQYDTLEDFLESEITVASYHIRDIEKILEHVHDNDLVEKIEYELKGLKDCLETIKVTAIEE